MKQKLLLYTSLLSLFFSINTSFITANPATTTAVVLGVKLDIRVFLKGALVGANTNTAFQMRDDLRSGGYLPTTEPYTGLGYGHIGLDGGDEAISDQNVLSVTGENAIVDWMVVELRDADNPAKVVATRSALLQRDGDVVDLDGVSSLGFDNMPAGEYYVAVRHRNHFGAMTAVPFTLDAVAVSLDFSDPDFATYGVEAQQEFSGKMVMRGGDFNGDGKIIYQGPFNDIYSLFSLVLSRPENSNYVANYIYYGYSNCDYNLDGKTIFIGPNNDRATLLYHSLGDCLLAQHPNCILEEQLPK